MCYYDLCVFWLVNQEDYNPINTSILVYKSWSVSGPGDKCHHLYLVLPSTRANWTFNRWSLQYCLCNMDINVPHIINQFKIHVNRLFLLTFPAFCHKFQKYNFQTHLAKNTYIFHLFLQVTVLLLKSTNKYITCIIQRQHFY